jgi:hypothetical protein
MIDRENADETLRRCNIPEGSWEGIKRYLFDHIEPGDFLTAIFANDFHGAIMQADEHNKACLTEYAHFLYWEVPGRGEGTPWGSRKTVKAWISNTGASI